MPPFKRTATVEEELGAGAKKVTSIDWSKADVQVERAGRKIILPSEPGPMNLDQAIEALQRLKRDEETMLDTFEIIDSYYTDALVALMQAMKQKFGWASPVPTPGFFGPTPPTMLTIKTGPEPGEQIQALWGSFQIPGIDNAIRTHMHSNEHGMPTLIISGKIRKREQKELKDLANLVREILARESIYKGRALRLKVEANGAINHNQPPEFLPVSYIKPEDLVLNAGEEAQVEVNVWTPIRETEACRKHRIPLKRGVLLEGTYGTGKTLIASVTSKVCDENGWTYILLDNVSALKQALLFATRYEPCVVFAEDAERVAGARDEKGNDLLNTIDGILGKNSQVITVLTTNHVDRLEKAMLRPGRLDAVISIKAPDKGAVERLLRIYGRDLLDPSEDLSDVAEAIQGNIPATIREIVERSKLGMIKRNALRITAQDLRIAADGMKDHLALLEPRPESETDAEVLARGVRAIVGEAVKSPTGLGDLVSKVNEIHEHYN